MARNRPNPLDDPPAASSSEEHHEEEEEDDTEEEVEEAETGGGEDKGSGSESETESESDDEEEEREEEVVKEEEKKILPQQQQQQQQPKPLTKDANPESDDETESGESESFTIRKHEVITPVSVKPKKPVSLKRTLPEADTKGSKGKKVKAGNGEEDANPESDDETNSDSSESVSHEHEIRGVISPAPAKSNKPVPLKADKKGSKSNKAKAENGEQDANPESDDETESGEPASVHREHENISPAPVKPVSLKRPAPEADKKGSKAKKVKAENGEQEAKKKVQVWSEKDVIAVLEAIVAFAEEKGLDPFADAGIAFHEYVKGKLSAEPTVAKLMDKIRRMKKKFVDHPKGDNGADPLFTKPNEKKSWDLSKKIWGGVAIQRKRSSPKKIPKENGNDGLAVVTRKEEAASHLPASKKSDDIKGRFSELYPFLNLSMKSHTASTSLTSKDGLEAMEGCLRNLEKSKLEELEAAWKKQIVAEADVVMGRSSILHKQLGMVSDWQAQRD